MTTADGIAAEPAAAGSDRLWTQRQAAAYLGVSCRYLRGTGCPRLELPGNGRKGRPLVRYKASAVMAWAQSRGLR